MKSFHEYFEEENPNISTEVLSQPGNNIIVQIGCKIYSDAAFAMLEDVVARLRKAGYYTAANLIEKGKI